MEHTKILWYSKLIDSSFYSLLDKLVIYDRPCLLFYLVKKNDFKDFIKWLEVIYTLKITLKIKCIKIKLKN